MLSHTPTPSSSTHDRLEEAALHLINTQTPLFTAPALHIDCGNGKLSAYISDKLNQPVLGLSLSPADFSIAEQHYSHTKAKFLLGDTRQLKNSAYAPNTFNTLFTFNALNGTPKKYHLKLLRNAKHYLSVSGKLVFTFQGRNLVLYEAINETFQSKEWKKSFSSCNIYKLRPTESSLYYRELCYRAGFYQVNTSAINTSEKNLNFAEARHAISEWLMQIPMLNILLNSLENNKDKLLDDITLLYFAKRFKTPDTSVKPIEKSLFLTAYKKPHSLFGQKPQRNETQNPLENCILLRSRL